MSKLKIKGVLPPMVTPFKENGDVDYQKFENNVAKWNDDGLCGYLVLGSNSETAYLSEEEKTELMKITVSTAAKDKLLIAGTGLESARETVKLTNKAAKLGIQAVLVLTPFYYISAMDSNALIRYFTEVANNSEIPVLIYNVPKFTHNNIKKEALEVLCQHPNIAGMKDSTGDLEQLKAFKAIVPDDFNLMVGTAGVWHKALQLGVTGGIHALSNCCPKQCVKIQELFEQGKQEEAAELQGRMSVINTAVTATYGVPGLKYVCDLLGYEGGYVRNPLIDANEEIKSDLKKIIAENIK